MINAAFALLIGLDLMAGDHRHFNGKAACSG
jgi:hypothetical protein